MERKERVFLAGPFIGELLWEFFNFAPYIIHLKREHPKKKLIVFTREERFDLYGRYADILVPFKITNDNPKDHVCFKTKNLTGDFYEQLAEAYNSKYSDRYEIIEHIYPDIVAFYYRLKWQFSRSLMDYSFRPRRLNKIICNKIIKKNDIIVDGIPFDSDNNNLRAIKDLNKQFSNFINGDSSILGCQIEAIRKCKLIIGNTKNNVTRLAIVLKTPVVLIDEKASDDEIYLMNPYNSVVIRANNVEEGIEYYENNF